MKSTVIPECWAVLFGTWVDQALAKPLEDGRIQMSYGGDFGDRPNSEAFCLNGVILADRQTTPKYWEVKKVYQPALFEQGKDQYHYRITNRNHHTNLDNYSLNWQVTADGRTIETGNMDLPAVAPGNSHELELPLSCEKKIPGVCASVFEPTAQRRGSGGPKKAMKRPGKNFV